MKFYLRFATVYAALCQARIIGIFRPGIAIPVRVPDCTIKNGQIQVGHFELPGSYNIGDGAPKYSQMCKVKLQ